MLDVSSNTYPVCPILHTVNIKTRQFKLSLKDGKYDTSKTANIKISG